MKAVIQKFTSRKFLVALSGILTGITLIAMGDTTQGITAVITAIVSYLIAEGIVDAKTAGDIAKGVAEKTENE